MSEGEAGPDAILTIRLGVEGQGKSIGDWKILFSAKGECLEGEKVRNWLADLSNSVGDELRFPPAHATLPEELKYERFRLPGSKKKRPRPPLENLELAERLEYFAQQFAFKKGGEVQILRHVVEFAIEEIFHRSMNGSFSAQVNLKLAADSVVDHFIGAADAQCPGIISAAESSLHIPGIVSICPEVSDIMVRMCKKVNQGGRYGLKMDGKRTGAKARNWSSFSTPKHRLCDGLFRYMEKYRLAGIQFKNLDGLLEPSGSIQPLVQRLISLPALSPKTVRCWLDASLEVIEDALRGKALASHPAFVAGGPYHALSGYDEKRGEYLLRRGLREAWRERAKREDAIRPRE